ncbi:hypothetical protein JX265_011480 [Neoarthrinium moseri]|uniref:Phosphoglycerate mutase n=1 Tax=Neoarthrinium moseri TaxID=1658444 RepID=A0A9P9WCM7_9PEZI|nr:hypothetical protein JX265_011480 [Neoarthrinium moseri]
MKQEIQRWLQLLKARPREPTPTDPADDLITASSSSDPATSNETATSAERGRIASARAFLYSFMPGYFVDYVEAAKDYPDAKARTLPKLGILPREYDVTGLDPSINGYEPGWTRFTNYLKQLNERSSNGDSYKVLFVVRHGLGVHNIVMEEVGSPAWNNYWSHLDGDGEVIWADAPLVDAGIAQAEELAQFWVDGVKNDGMPLPGSLYTSPLVRCLETTKLVYTPVFNSHGRKVRPIVKELLRELLTDHTCDRRSTRSRIADSFPESIIEPGFTEEDELWNKDSTESPEEHDARKQRLLEDIFSNDSSPFVSLTTHSYALSAILRVIGAPKFRIAEATMVPLFIKAERIHPNQPQSPEVTEQVCIEAIYTSD